jgi:hypothetical protein
MRYTHITKNSDAKGDTKMTQTTRPPMSQQDRRELLRRMIADAEHALQTPVDGWGQSRTREAVIRWRQELRNLEETPR